ncbi:MAG TPA: response regulator, partial [Bryobacteraceae bacterium]|nr:response regulator [Bryobacteraceae bacterium]
MAEQFKHQILVVDDDLGVRNSLRLLLQAAGYEVTLAEHGFDALSQLKHNIPAIVLSDLHMPEMSGFEFLSVVRRRFPEISVIAMSGAYETGDAVPGGVIADAFFTKGGGNPQALLRTVADLLRRTEAHIADHQKKSAPAWVRRNGNDSNGVPYVVLACTDCLRSFPLNVTSYDLPKIQETPCPFCSNIVRYVVDFSLSIASPRPEARLAAISVGKTA